MAETKEVSTIEELATKNEVNTSVLAGVRVLKDWGKGKKVTEKEFKSAVTKLLKTSI